MGFGVFSGISWTIRKQCASRCRQITTQTPCHLILTGRVLFLTPSQQYQSTKDTWMGSHNDKCTISLLNGRCSRHQRSTSRHLLAVPRFRLAVGGSQLLARWPGTHSRILSGIQRAAQTVLGVYLERFLQCFDTVGWAAGSAFRPAKYCVAGCWRGCLSGARCRLAYGPADSSATHCLLLQ